MVFAPYGEKGRKWASKAAYLRELAAFKARMKGMPNHLVMNDWHAMNNPGGFRIPPAGTVEKMRLSEKARKPQRRIY